MRDVARVEYRGFRGFAQTVMAVREDVSERAQHHAVVSEKGFHASDRLRVVKVEFEGGRISGLVFNPVATAPGSDNSRYRQECCEFFRATHRARSRAAAAVRRRKGLMKIQVDH